MSRAELGKYSRQGKALLNDLRDLSARLLQNDVQLDQEFANQVANELAFQIAQHWGGQSVYIIKDDTFLADERDLKIYNECNGINHSELARKYKISVQYVYRIVKRVSEAERARRQPDLFAS